MTETEQIVGAYKITAAKLLKNPDDPEQLSNQFALLIGGGPRSPSHLILAKRAAELAPDNFTALFNLGSAYLRAAKYPEGLRLFQRALEIAPEDKRADALAHVGLAFEMIDNFDQALVFYNKAIALRPDDKELYQSRALAILETGDLAKGMFEFECKHYKPPRKVIGNSGIPRWTGEPLDGKHIVFHHEQGFGDTIQFCRILPQIKAGKLTVAMPPSLMPLIKTGIGFKADAWVNEEGPFKADYYCSPMSAHGALGVSYKQISGKPYFKADPIKLPERGKLKVGLVWRGSAGYSADVERSVALADFAPLLEIPHVAFYSLQVGEANKEVSKLGLDGFIGDLTGLIKDWSDTARCMAAMDLVISVDTSSAHLAGALGVPVWTLLARASGWRWLRNTTKTPFYDSMTLFRQQVPGDYATPIASMATKLRGMV